MLVLSLFLLFPYCFHPSHHLIISSFYLISSHPHILSHQRAKYRYIIVDNETMSPDWFPFPSFLFTERIWRLTDAAVDFGGGFFLFCGLWLILRLCRSLRNFCREWFGGVWRCVVYVMYCSIAWVMNRGGVYVTFGMLCWVGNVPISGSDHYIY